MTTSASDETKFSCRGCVDDCYQETEVYCRLMEAAISWCMCYEIGIVLIPGTTDANRTLSSIGEGVDVSLFTEERYRAICCDCNNAWTKRGCPHYEEWQEKRS